jgi:hypothetical protein
VSHDHGQICPCVADHRPAPLELNRHHIHPLAAGGPDDDSNIAWICPTTHANVHELLRLIVARCGDLPWTVVTALYEQPVSRYAFHLAHEGWRRMTAAKETAA